MSRSIRVFVVLLSLLGAVGYGIAYKVNQHYSQPDEKPLTADELRREVLLESYEKRLKRRQDRPVAPHDFSTALEAERYIASFGGKVTRLPLFLGGWRVLLVRLNGADFADEDCATLTKLSGAKQVSLQGTLVHGEGLKYLAGFGRVESVNLGDTPLVDENLRHLSDLKSLDSLRLDNTLIDGSGLRHLSGLEKLQRLSVRHTSVEEIHFESLTGLPALEDLDVGQTRFGDKACKAVKSIRSLKRVKMSGT